MLKRKLNCESYKNWRLLNIDKLREYRKKWEAKNKENHIVRAKKYRQKNKIITKTGSLIMNKNKFPIGPKCKLCGNTNSRRERHHFDYSKPFEYITLCNKCHKWWHTSYNSLKKEWS